MAKRTKRIFDTEDNKDIKPHDVKENGGSNSQDGTRINKFISDAGVCSRRQADELIAGKKVTIDGIIAEMGSKVLSGQDVKVNGKSISRDEKLVLIALNKPRGIVCTTDSREPDNVIDFLKYGKRIYPIGRLDKDSEGLLLLTNHGDIVNKILRAGNFHEKEYIVTVNKPITDGFIQKMSTGVPILDTVTKPCFVEEINKTTFRIILKQGMNRQIRRMCEYLDYNVRTLQRIRIMNVNLGRLKIGDYRNLTEIEIQGMKKLLADSTNLAAATEDEKQIPKEPGMEGKKPNAKEYGNSQKNYNPKRRQGK